MLAAQPPLLTGLMVAAWFALLILARSWGAVRLTWTPAAAARAALGRPAAASGFVAKSCRCAAAL
jgi:hypothetical protein